MSEKLIHWAATNQMLYRLTRGGRAVGNDDEPEPQPFVTLTASARQLGRRTQPQHSAANRLAHLHRRTVGIGSRTAMCGECRGATFRASVPAMMRVRWLQDSSPPISVSHRFAGAWIRAALHVAIEQALRDAE